MQPIGVRLGAFCATCAAAACDSRQITAGGNGGLDELRFYANPRSPVYVRATRVQPGACLCTERCARSLRTARRVAALICAASEACLTGEPEAPASLGAGPDPNVATASSRWFAATSPEAYVPPALLDELLSDSLSQEAQRCVLSRSAVRCATDALRRSDALCGNTLAVLRLRRFPSSAPAGLALHPAGRNRSAVRAQLVYQRTGGDVGLQPLADLELGALPLLQVALSPGELDKRVRGSGHC